MGALILILLMIVGYLLVRRHIFHRFTDPVTKRNRSQLGRYLLILAGVFFLLLLWMAITAPRP
jgi:hypothetical protein